MQPPEAEHPGLGMSWDDAIKMGPLQARFVLQSHKQIIDMERACRLLRLNSEGHTNTEIKQAVRVSVKEHYANLREAFVGSRNEPPRANPRYSNGRRTNRSRNT